MYHFLTAVKIDLHRTLFSGQTFLWSIINNEYFYVLKGTLISLKSEESGIYFKIHAGLKEHIHDSMVHEQIQPTKLIETDENTENKRTLNVNAQGGVKAFKKQKILTENSTTSKLKSDLINYFNLEINQDDLIKDWSKDEVFRNKTKNFTKARMLNQDPVETIFQFICSQNNNIKRITSLVNTLASLGTYLATIEDKKFYAFPTLEQLAAVSEQEFREAGFGYRAKYIHKTAIQLLDDPKFIPELLRKEYKDAKKSLMLLNGGVLLLTQLDPKLQIVYAYSD
jgi:3-methyladenine DNA glycosylase/8-oxoguanine DNA glycosylase